ncbi:amino acid adenylation protein [Actinosynnema pretiosum]|uniref:Amino acid adenylation protein n=1 Tax=Actinosynnema pretiosum TaxID=42197 RepID=A0A290Z9I2_9PSEU|nr:amino acid adenylation protein [Actinosynnema pretiosum]
MPLPGLVLSWWGTAVIDPGEWARAGSPSAERGLHLLVADRAADCADRPALVHGDTRLTHAELDARANGLAHRLVAAGVRVDDVVGLCVDRSFGMVVGLLAILKAGGAYLPLDPELPPARIERITTAANARACVVAERHRALLPGHVTALAPEAEPAPTPPDRRAAGDNLVSVYFTSGSTGVPKGVASSHAGWVNRMAWSQRAHRLAPGDTVLHKTTLTFDDAALELFWPLAAGARVALLDPGAHRDPIAVLDALHRHRSVYLQVVPTMLAALLDEIARDRDRWDLSALRDVTSSGEALPTTTVRRFLDLLPSTRLHNTWGATEVSIDSTNHTCGPADAEDTGAASVGLPMTGNHVRVLDAELREVPLGEVGDLHISGVGLARGYLGDPAATAAAFGPDPFEPGGRLYRTGDRGYRRPDGTVKFVGRDDHQVKIRGMRVELGEVEAALRRSPLVRDAAVLLRRLGEADQLVGYVTPADAQEPPRPEPLRDALADWLPAHMVPARVVVLDAFPLNANGKVDRARLPEPGPLADADDAGFTPPSGPAQEAIAAMWRELLGVPRVGADDDFFDLGGHSLLATRFTARVRHRFDVELPVRVVFDRPVVAELAEEVEALLAAKIQDMSDDQVRALLGDRSTR